MQINLEEYIENATDEVIEVCEQTIAAVTKSHASIEKNLSLKRKRRKNHRVMKKSTTL
jgi:hypothetical protein